MSWSNRVSQKALRNAKRLEEIVFEACCDMGDTYVDVGANFPVKGSVTWPLYNAGRRGIIIEPLLGRKTMRRLRSEWESKRPQDVMIAKALGADEGSLDLYIGGREHGLTSYLDYWYVRSSSKPFTVPMTTLNSVCAAHREICSRCKLLKIDVEGYEVSVIDGWDIDGTLKPGLVVLESLDRITMSHKLERYRKLETRYTCVERVGADTVWRRKVVCAST